MFYTHTYGENTIKASENKGFVLFEFNIKYSYPLTPVKIMSELIMSVVSYKFDRKMTIQSYCELLIETIIECTNESGSLNLIFEFKFNMETKEFFDLTTHDVK